VLAFAPSSSTRCRLSLHLCSVGKLLSVCTIVDLFACVGSLNDLEAACAGHAMMSALGRTLKRLAVKYRLAVLVRLRKRTLSQNLHFDTYECDPVQVTNHTVSAQSDGGDVKPALGETWSYMPDTRLAISLLSSPPTQLQFKLIKSNKAVREKACSASHGTSRFVDNGCRKRMRPQFAKSRKRVLSTQMHRTCDALILAPKYYSFSSWSTRDGSNLLRCSG